VGTYRVYRLDGLGRIRAVEMLDALDDRFALEGARAIAEAGGCEVWQLGRKVGVVRGATPRDAPRSFARRGGVRPTARI
jgi:hypothetical protein